MFNFDDDQLTNWEALFNSSRTDTINDGLHSDGCQRRPFNLEKSLNQVAGNERDEMWTGLHRAERTEQGLRQTMIKGDGFGPNEEREQSEKWIKVERDMKKQ